jgi:hypothetical protein
MRERYRVLREKWVSRQDSGYGLLWYEADQFLRHRLYVSRDTRPRLERDDPTVAIGTLVTARLSYLVTEAAQSFGK